jgi:hypothetical protein
MSLKTNGGVKGNISGRHIVPRNWAATRAQLVAISRSSVRALRDQENRSASGQSFANRRKVTISPISSQHHLCSSADGRIQSRQSFKCPSAIGNIGIFSSHPIKKANNRSSVRRLRLRGMPSLFEPLDWLRGSSSTVRPRPRFISATSPRSLARAMASPCQCPPRSASRSASFLGRSGGVLSTRHNGRAVQGSWLSRTQPPLASATGATSRPGTYLTRQAHLSPDRRPRPQDRGPTEYRTHNWPMRRFAKTYGAADRQHRAARSACSMLGITSRRRQPRPSAPESARGHRVLFAPMKPCGPGSQQKCQVALRKWGSLASSLVTIRRIESPATAKSPSCPRPVTSSRPVTFSRC